ncbi:MAG: hypothetical protein ACM3UZ_15330 [Acidobacteriota bacterium]
MRLNFRERIFRAVPVMFFLVALLTLCSAFTVYAGPQGPGGFHWSNANIGFDPQSAELVNLNEQGTTGVPLGISVDDITVGSSSKEIRDDGISFTMTDIRLNGLTIE